MKRHTLTSLFRAILAPVLNAWRDEFSPRVTPSRAASDQNATFGASEGMKHKESLVRAGSDHAQPAPVPFGWASLDIALPAEEPARVAEVSPEPVALADAAPVRKPRKPRKAASKPRAMQSAERKTVRPAKAKPAKRKGSAKGKAVKPKGGAKSRGN